MRSSWPNAGRSPSAMILGTAAAALILAAPGPPVQDPRVSEFELYMTARAELGQFSGAVLVARDGEVLFHSAFGLADREHGVAATTGTRFRVASLTKQFTAAAVLLLQEDGLLSVDDPISSHLPDLPESWSAITIHQLLRHTSGVSDYEEWFDGYTTPEYSDFMSQHDPASRIVEEAKRRPLDFEPGTDFRYSNTGYVLLGYLIEHVSGQPYADFLRKRIFDSLDMRETSNDRSERILENRARGYALAPGSFNGPYWNGMKPDDFRNANYQYMDPPQADAGLVTTVGDLYLWDRALDSDRLLPRRAREVMFTPGPSGYGYGWRIRDGEHGTEHRHTGGLPGFACEIVRLPDADATIIVLSNVQSLPGWIVRDLSAILFGEPWALPQARSVVPYDSIAHGGREGIYTSAGGDTLRVYYDGIPVLAWRDHFEAGLFPETADRFYAALIEGEVRFSDRSDGSTELTVVDRFGTELITARRRAP